MPVLKAKIDGVWVPLGSGGSGNDEVAIGPTVPTDPGIELWYDTDDPQGQAGGVPSGGVAGQVLTKLGNEDYNVGWGSTFPDATALKLWQPSNGATAVTTDKGRLWLRHGNVWRCVGGAMPRFELQRNAAYTITGSAVVGIPWDTEVLDTDDMHAPNANTVTIPADYPGRWRFEMQIAISTNTSGGTWASWFSPSGSGLRWGWVEMGRAAGGGMVLLSVTEYRAVAAEVINAYVFANISNVDIAVQNTRFTGQYMGPS